MMALISHETHSLMVTDSYLYEFGGRRGAAPPMWCDRLCMATAMHTRNTPANAQPPMMRPRESWSLSSFLGAPPEATDGCAATQVLVTLSPRFRSAPVSTLPEIVAITCCTVEAELPVQSTPHEKETMTPLDARLFFERRRRPLIQSETEVMEKARSLSLVTAASPLMNSRRARASKDTLVRPINPMLAETTVFSPGGVGGDAATGGGGGVGGGLMTTAGGGGLGVGGGGGVGTGGGGLGVGGDGGVGPGGGLPITGGRGGGLLTTGGDGGGGEGGPGFGGGGEGGKGFLEGDGVMMSVPYMYVGWSVHQK